MVNDEKVFDPEKMVAEAQKTLILDDEDGPLRYRCFSLGMACELGKVADASERSISLVYLMLHDEYPELVRDDIKQWPAVKFRRILEKLAKAGGIWVEPPSVSGEAKP